MGRTTRLRLHRGAYVPGTETSDPPPQWRLSVHASRVDPHRPSWLGSRAWGYWTTRGGSYTLVLTGDENRRTEVVWRRKVPISRVTRTRSDRRRVPCAFDGGLGATSSRGGTLRRLGGAVLDRVGAGEQLDGTMTFGDVGRLGVWFPWIIEAGLLVVEQVLAIISGVLCVIEHVLGCLPPLLREPGLGLTETLVRTARVVIGIGVGRAVTFGLLAILAHLVAVDDRLLAVADRLLEGGDALLGVQILL
jgi:hypothetical protein